MLKTENLLLKHCNKIFFKSQNTLFTRFWCWPVMNSAMGPAKKAKTKRQTQTTAIPKQSMTCTKTIRKPNSSNFHKHRKIQTSKTGQQRKAWVHTIIHKPQQVWRKKKKKGMTCTKTITKHKQFKFS